MTFTQKLLAGWCGLVFAFSLEAQPIITSQPVNQMVVWGKTAIFSVAVTGLGPFNYQWRYNGTNLPNIITTVAGNGAAGFSGDGGTATNASLYFPQGLAFDAAGDLYIADNNNERIRKVDANGIITTIAGNGTAGFSGDGVAATNTALYQPNNLAFDAMGNMYIADIFNSRIRKVDTNGIISTVAGSFSSGYAGDGGSATGGRLNYPACVAFDTQGNYLIADLFNFCIRKVDTNGIISTAAGKPVGGFSGDGGMATNAVFQNCQGVAFDAAGNYYVVDTGNMRIRKVDTNGIVITVAGGGGRINDGIAATNSRLGQPWGVTFDATGNMYIADEGYGAVRKVDTNGIISTVAGRLLNSGYSGDGGAATNAWLNKPACVALDRSGNLFIADWGNNRIRKVQLVGLPMLTLGNVTVTNMGNYSVVVTSSSGSVTSSVANLNVQLPAVSPTFTASNNLCTFTWDSVPNLSYQLQSTTNLITPNWVDLGTHITAVSNSVFISVTNGSDAQYFYRVRRWP